ncbi:MAG: hypothetical protein M1530_02880, partial [Candidatus Marsarchaeota archaeon]|nr:hypothetical protein [Candidatus Marsarchaeota archaeon]
MGGPLLLPRKQDDKREQILGERLVSAFCSLYPDAVLNTARGQVGGPFIMVEAGAWRTYPFKFNGEPV